MDFNWYLDPITNHYVDFEGVVGRKPFWMFALFNFLIALGLSIVLNIIHLSPLSGLYHLAVLLPSLGLGVRRLHDIGIPLHKYRRGYIQSISFAQLGYGSPSPRPLPTLRRLSREIVPGRVRNGKRYRKAGLLPGGDRMSILVRSHDRTPRIRKTSLPLLLPGRRTIRDLPATVP